MARKRVGRSSVLKKSTGTGVHNRKVSRARLQYELLEPRHLLAAEIGLSQSTAVETQNVSSAPLTWFETVAGVERVPLKSLASVDRLLPAGVAGPIPLAAGEWIVQLRDDAARTVRRLAQADVLLDDLNNDFTIISGLGSRGALLVRGDGPSRADVEASLRDNPRVQTYHLNQMVQGQTLTPNDPDFVAGQLPGLTKINAPGAWNESIGSMTTVVGVVDSGIDPTHTDLYLNIWLNQGEIPRRFVEGDGDKLVDIDGDGLITFYDLNNVTRSTETPYSLIFGGWENGPNAQFVNDLNGNGRIDAADLLLDANWADGRDTDGNGFFDDLFGVNFRAGAGDPFSRNNPSDQLGHGTHVAGTIGAIGGNGTGVVGVNWQTSLMSLRILDNNNQGDSGAAIAAINYARMMRERLRTGVDNRVIEGANVRVLNNSWGQPGGYEASLEAAIEQLYGAGILFVAAAGNGNILGQGVDNDRTPFYPASYDVPNVIAVAAADANDRLATFSNFGRTSVDILAPGVGIRSTVPGGGYQSANGTSMAAPHVAGTAALIWSALPGSTIDEVKQAIISTTTPASQTNIVSTNGRLNANAAINADVFAPAARLIAKQDITTTGGTHTEFTIEYSHRSGIDISTIGDDDIIVTRQWGPRDQITATLKPGSISETGTIATATYIVEAPGGSWDILDYGDYLISTNREAIYAKDSGQIVEPRDIGRFTVRITNDTTIPGHDPTVIYVELFNDTNESGTLRSAIIEANAARPAHRTIILTSGHYTIDIAPEIDTTLQFLLPQTDLFCASPDSKTGFSNETSGDFDILGNVSVWGDINDYTILDGNRLDRLFKVHENGTLNLHRVTLTNGLAPFNQGGGAILSSGTLLVRDSNIAGNTSSNTDMLDPARGGGIAVWAGTAEIHGSWIDNNEANYGGGIFFCGASQGVISQSAITNNVGGGLHSHSTQDIYASNSTFSGNRGGLGAVFHGKRDGFDVLNSSYTDDPALSSNGRYVVFYSNANFTYSSSSVVGGIFVHDQYTTQTERVSVNTAGEPIEASNPAISADGRFVVFESSSPEIEPGGGLQTHIYVHDRHEKTTTRVSRSDLGLAGNNGSYNPSISGNGRFIAFQSFARNLVAGEQSAGYSIFVFDQQTKRIERVSINNDGAVANGSSVNPTLNYDGRYVAFQSDASNLTTDTPNASSSVFVFDRQSSAIQRLAISTKVGAQYETNGRPAISDDGRLIAFQSTLDGEPDANGNPPSQIITFDRLSGDVSLISKSSSGAPGDAESHSTAISADGRYIAFSSQSSNLLPGSTGGGVYVFDRLDNETRFYPGDGTKASLSGDGQLVAFSSRSNNLLPSDPNRNNFPDVFLVNQTTSEVTSPAIFPTLSTLHLKQVTISNTLLSQSSVGGKVNLSDVLFASEKIGIDDLRLVEDNVLRSTVLGTQLVHPLSRTGYQPPAHLLLAGNPAIDSGNTEYTGTFDQNQVVRVTPDIGAVEAVSASLFGTVFVDSNSNALFDDDEVGIPEVTVQLALRSDHDGQAFVSTAIQSSSFGSPLGPGNFLFSNVPPGDYDISVSVPPGWQYTNDGIRRVPEVQPNGSTRYPSVSDDGSVLAFQSRSSNLVQLASGSGTGYNIYTYSPDDRRIELISLGYNGLAGQGLSVTPVVSGNGRFVAYASAAPNLIPNDTNNRSDIFVFDRVSRITERVSVASDGSQANGDSSFPTISDDGRFVAFQSEASNLVDNDTNGLTDAFVFDRLHRIIRRANVNSSGDQSNGAVFGVQISGDGNSVSFSTHSSNLVENDTNGRSDVFVFDLLLNRTERVSSTTSGAQAAGGTTGSHSASISRNGRFVAFLSNSVNMVDGVRLNGDSLFLHDRDSNETFYLFADRSFVPNATISSASISDNGRFVAFSSVATNLVPDDNNNAEDIFIVDRETDQLRRLSSDRLGQDANGASSLVKISGDGRFIAFSSSASNLISSDSNFTSDVFLIRNPFLAPGLSITLSPGDFVSGLDFALTPLPGSVSGRVFEDDIQNGIYDFGETTFAGLIVYIDANDSGTFDAGERSVLTSLGGVYHFPNVDSHRQHSVRVRTPSGFDIAADSSVDGQSHRFFLPAGGEVTGRDFALRPVQSTGQSSRSEVAGRLFVDKNNNGVFDLGIDQPLSNKEVFLDASNFGVRDDNEPRTLTDNQGRYSFDGLSARNAAVTTVLDQTLVHVNPLGSKFHLAKYPLFGAVTPFGNPQVIASGDFNGDGFLDVAVALGEANKLSIRLNDGEGGFLPDEIDINLGNNGAGPTSLVVGQFDNDPRLDVALTANFAGFVTVLRNFDPSTKAFASVAYVKVGDEPLDIAAGNFAGDDKLDLVVVNKANNTVQVLTNNGSGVFIAGPGVPTGGRNASSIVVGNFTGDASLDVAVVHASPRTGASNPFGEVTVLRGNGSGGLTRQPEFYTVGATPTDAVVADFNGDGRPDIAVSNFATNSISILLGQADGTFRVQSAILGTASGAFDIAVGDVDNDGDIDIFASNLRDRNISIFRNDGPNPVTGDVRFQPLENIGLGQFSLAQRMPIVVGNFDNDASGPGGSGTIDIVTIPQRTDTLHVLKNTLVNGAHRVALTGLNTVTDRDFIIKPAILPPSFNAIVNPLAIFEDAAPQSIAVTGIVKGRTTGPQLQFTATSSNPALIASPTVTYSGGTTATVQYTPLANMSGTTVITVRAVDAGADALFGGADDGIFERSFTVSVLAVNDAPVFNLVPEATVLQTDGATTIPNFVTGVGNGGGADEASQTLDPLVVTASDPSFFTVQPAINAAGTLTFTPNPNNSGSVPVTVTLKDSGGRDNGGVDTTTKTFLVIIGTVNDPPSFTLMANPNRSVVQTAGPQTINNFVTAFSPGGGPDEATQTVSDYIVTVDAPGIFAVLPDISNDGTLTFTPAVDRTGLATVTVQVRDSGGRANGGNDLSAVTTFTISVAAAPDVTRPTPVISYVGAALTNQTTFDVEVDFKEPIATGTFTLSDFTVSKGTTSNLRDLGGGKFVIAYTGDGQGEVTFGVAANVATDLAGNQNFAATSITRTIDTVGITPTLSTTAPAVSNVTSFVVAIAFGEPAIGFTLSDIVVLNGTASNLVTVNAATGSYTATITPAADGTVTVLLPAGSVTDVAGNANAAATPLVRTIDQTAPVAVLSTTEPSRTNKTTFDVIAEFGETVTGLATNNLTIQGGTAGAPVLLSPGRYRFPITATNGPVQIQLAAGAVTDTAGNANTASNTIDLTVDTAAFVPVLSSTSNAVLNTNTFDVAVDFGKAVASFTGANITLSGGTASNITTVDATSGKYSFTVTATDDGSVTVLVAAGVVRDTAGNGNSASNSLVRTVDRVAPRPTLSTNVLALTNQASFIVTIDFGKEVTGFTLSDIVTTGATLSSLQSLGAGRFTATATSTGGAATFDVPASAANDLAGNASLAATALAVTVDLSAPLPTLSTTAPALSNAASFTVAANFGEEVVGFALGDLLMINGVASGFTEVNRATGSYMFVVTPSSDGVVSVLVPAGSATDRAGNLTLASSLLSRSFDRQMAVPVLTTTEPARTNKTTFEVIANFGEVVTGLTQSDFQVTGGTLGNPVDLGGGRYALTISNASGLVEMQVNAGAVTDAAGNTNLASAKLSVTVDTAALIPVLSSTSTNLLNTNVFDVTVVFGKQVNNFAATNITLLGGTASNFVVADASSGRFTFTVTADGDGNVTVLVAAGVVSDTAGNLNAASNTLVRTIDRGRPQPVLGVPFTGVTNSTTFDLTIDFAEEVTGFDLADIVATGATLSNFRSVGGGRYLATATAAHGPVTFAVAASVATDLAGNQNLAATTLTREIDTVGVTATLSSTAPSLTNAATIPLAISFGEPVVGFTLSDLTVLGGTATNLITVNAATGSFTATITPTADGTVTVLLPAGLVTDAAGNGNSATVPLIRTVDRTSPTVTLTTNEPERTNRTTFDVFAQFSEPVTGLARAGLNISGGTASDPVLVSPGLYRFTITASVGAVQMQVVASAANDLAGNASGASSPLTITVDPAVVFTPTISSTSATILGVVTFNAAVNFGTQVNGFAIGDIVVVNGVASNLTVVDVATGRYSFNITATVDGQVSVLLPAGIANDLSGNANSASNTLVRLVDRVAPQPTLSVNVPSLTNQSNFVLTVEFGEEVTGFVLGDVVVSGATLSALQHLGGGRYTMNVTATHGSISFNLPAGIANDLAGNPNVAATQVGLQVDTSSPLPTLTTTAPELSNAASFTVAANFGDEVVGFAIGDLLLINGVASNLIEVNRATGSYTFVVTPSSDGVVSVLVPAGSATDRAGNLTLASSLLSRSFDRQMAIPVLTTTEPARTNKTTFEVIANFGEVVTGLTQSDFQVTGGTIGNPVDLGGGRYALTISGASGLVEVQVNAGAVTDAAGNTNLASAKLSVTVDTAALIPVLSSTSTNLLNTNTIDMTVVFGKQVNGFGANNITLLGGTASNFVTADAAGGRFTFTVTAAGDGNVTVLVAAGVVTDAAGNLNAASNALVRTIDRARPQPVLSVPFTGVTNLTTFDLTIDFAEQVTGFELADIVATGATLSNFRSVGGGRYLATATAANGPVTFAVAAGVASDLAGNTNLAAAMLSRTIDTVGVTATLSSTAPSLTNAATIPLAISFGEPVVGFTLSDLTVLGGTASNLVTVNAATGSFTATITPTADGTVTVLLPAGLVTDAAGNGNSATVPLIRTFDRTSPTVKLTTNEPERTNRTTFDVFAQFSEPVTGLARAGLNISGGTASDPVLVSPGLYRFTITASVGAVQMQVVASAANDLAGNASLASSPLTITVDPAVVFTPTVSSTSATVLGVATFTAAVNFGTQVNGFTLDDIVVVNGVASNLTTVDLATGRYTFTVTATADGQVSVLLPAGIANDLSGNANSASNTLVRLVDRVAPQPTLSVNVPSLTNQSNFVLTVEFGEEVTGFVLGDVVVSGATLSALQHLGGGRYTMNVTATHGPVTFNLPAGIANDLAGNANVAATQVALTVDTSSPLPTLTTTTPQLSNAASFTVAANFGEEVVGFAIGDLLLINGVASNLIEVNRSTGSYTFVVTPINDGVASVLVPAGAAADQAGNLNRVSSLISRTFDRIAPIPILTTSEPSRTNKTTFEVIVNFGEAVTGLTKSDFQVTGATIGDPQPLGGGRYAVTLSGASGLVEVQVAAGAVQDEAGNNSVASEKLSLTVDTTAIVPVLSSNSGNLINANQFDVTVLFGKEVTGFAANKITVLGGTIANFVEADRATGRYTFNVQTTGDGPVNVVVSAGVVTDLAGNSNSASNTLLRTIDRAKPQPTLSVPFESITNQSNFDVTVDFGEAVTGFELTDLVVSGATLSNLRLVSGGRYLVTASATHAALSIGLPADRVSDLAGNTNVAATTLTRTIDLQPVNVTLSSAVASLSNVSSFVVAIDFAESVHGFTLSDITVLGGSASSLVIDDAATGKYSVTVTPSGNGNVTVLLPANSVTDSAGNGNLAAAPLVRTIDRVAPVAMLSTGEPERTNKATFEVFADFGKTVTGLTRADLSISGGTASDPVAMALGRYRFTITATGGPVQMQLVASAVQDAAGNSSPVSNVLEINVDATAFVPVLASNSPTVLNSPSFTVSVDFGKQVNGFTANQITVLGGTATNIVAVDAAVGRYTFTVTASADGPVSVLLSGGVLNDLAGNPNSASNTLVRIVDRIAPQPRLSVNVPSLTNQANFVLTVEFGEEVTGFELNDVEASGATLSALQHIGGGRYTMNVTATHGPVSFNLPGGVANDLAGNASLAATPISLTVDTSSPLPTLTTMAPPLSNAGSFVVAANFDERVNGFELSDLLLINGVASDLVEVNQATGSYTFVVTPINDGVASVLIPAGAATDQAGNLSRASSMLSRSFDRTAPIPVLATTEPSRTNRTTFEAIVNFGEPVTGLTRSDFAVTGATISDPLDLGGGRYAINITATADVVEVSLPAGAAIDNAGNPSSASNLLVRTIETTRVLPLLNASIPQVSNVSSFVVSIDFTKAVAGFAQSSLFAVGGTLSEFTVVDQATGRYSVRVTPTTDGAVTLLLPANAATDSVGNGNLAAAPLVRTIDRVAPAITLSTSQSSPTLERSFAVIIQSSEAITGLTASSFQVSGGTIGQPLPLGDGRYSVAVTATGGMFELSVRGGAVTDAAGNVNAASNVLRIEVTPQTPPSTPTLAPTLAGQSIDLAAMADGDLVNLEVIDLRGFGDNVLSLDSDKIRNLFANSSVTVYADSGDTILFDGDWRFERIELVGGEVHRVFTNSGATIRTIGPSDFTNPRNRFDVDGSGEVTALDALHVLTSIRAQQIVDSQGGFLPLTAENRSSFQFVDVNQDNVLTPLDALLILIEMRRMLIAAEGPSGEQVIAPPQQKSSEPVAAATQSHSVTDDLRIGDEGLQVIDAPQQDLGYLIPFGPQRAESDTISRIDDTDEVSKESVSLIDEAFADPLLLE